MLIRGATRDRAASLGDGGHRWRGTAHAQLPRRPDEGVPLAAGEVGAAVSGTSLDLFGTEAAADAVGHDATPIETGGAIVIVRLAPAEVDALRELAPTLVEGIHIAIAHVCEDDPA
jgi:hypothetical protein